MLPYDPRLEVGDLKNARAMRLKIALSSLGAGVNCLVRLFLIGHHRQNPAFLDLLNRRFRLVTEVLSRVHLVTNLPMRKEDHLKLRQKVYWFQHSTVFC